MAQITCVVVFADGTRCDRRRKYATGWCHACDGWPRRNGGKDPNGRTPKGRLESGTCLVTFANGAPCGRPARYAPGWCVNCWKWSREHGTSPHGRPYVRSNGEVRAELEAAARVSGDGCVILDGLGYRWTTDTVTGSQINAARVVWMLANGDPGDDQVLHTCHRGDDGCISIRHLYLGDQARNMLDMAEAGRGSTASRGELSPRAKLTRDQVLDIRRRYVKGARYPHPGSARALAEEFGISRDYVPELAAAGRWAWLEDDAAAHEGHTEMLIAQTVHVVATT
ncbi:hypothetical protein ABTX34_29020 [Streptomyces sp. NPDC096538]|uniref:hypothetical protein n=1 Tax=Streptomyces sp. NPDC096538 TaxID=3155427 RepID=UPI003320A20F